jgi:hypothetical protein
MRGRASHGLFGSGFPWARKALEAIQSLPEDKLSSCGLVFGREGVPYPISTVQRKAQILFKKHHNLLMEASGTNNWPLGGVH